MKRLIAWLLDRSVESLEAAPAAAAVREAIERVAKLHAKLLTIRRDI